MANPGKSVGAEIRYELQIVAGPFTFTFRGETIDVPSGGDLAVLARLVSHGEHVISRDIVGVVADEVRHGIRALADLRRFLINGGVIGISEDLQ